jgi:D-xylose 1-dehydrogenase
MSGAIEKPAVFPSLADRSVFITGGGSGIGESLVEHFCAQGAKVSFVDVAEEASRALVARLGRAGAFHRLRCPRHRRAAPCGG